MEINLVALIVSLGSFLFGYVLGLAIGHNDDRSNFNDFR